MRKLLALLILLSFMTAAFAYVCPLNNTFIDSFNVRTLDAKYRVLPGAQVRVTFDRGENTVNNNMFTTSWRTTDQNGLYPFTISGYRAVDRIPDCHFYLEATAGGQTVSNTIVAMSHDNPVDMTFNEVYPVNFIVQDQDDNPLPNSTIIIGNFSFLTNQNGIVRAYLMSGQYTYLANYLEGKKAGSLQILDDTNYQIIIPGYTIRFAVMDDFGNPLNATIGIGNRTYNITNGELEIPKAFGEDIPYLAKYSGLVKSGDIYPATKPDTSIIFDEHSPIFASISTQIIGNHIRLTIPVTDPGAHASGVDPSSFSMTYKVDPTDPSSSWQKATAFASGRNLFSADFLNLPPDKVVEFKVHVADYEGNIATEDGRFSSFTTAQNITNNQYQNNTIQQVNGGKTQEIPLLYIVGGVILLILVVYLLFRTLFVPKVGE